MTIDPFLKMASFVKIKENQLKHKYVYKKFANKVFKT